MENATRALATVFSALSKQYTLAAAAFRTTVVLIGRRALEGGACIKPSSLEAQIRVQEHGSIHDSIMLARLLGSLAGPCSNTL